MQRDTLRRTAAASGALGGAQFVAKLIDFALVLVLARLLTPEDFALIAIAMIFVQITEAILEVPIVQVLTQTKRVTRDMLYTAFSIAMARSLIVITTILVLTPIAAAMFNEHRLYALMPVLALGPAARGLVNPKMVLFTRRLNYFPQAIISIITRLITALIALPLAITTQSYWALAVITVVSPLMLVIATYSYLPFRPKISFRSWGVFANMVGWSTVAQLFTAAYWQSSVFILAQFASRTRTGNYSVAGNVNGTAHFILVAPILKPFISSFSELKRKGALEENYLIAVRAVFMFSSPMFIGIALLAEPTIMLLFGNDWSEAPIFLANLAICSAITIAALPSQSAAYALDRTIYIAISASSSFIVLATTASLGYLWLEIHGFLAGQIVGASFSLLLSFWVVKRLIGISFARQIGSLLLPATCVVIMAGYAYQAAGFIMYESILTLVGSLVGVSITSAFVYVFVVYGFWFLRGRPEGLEKEVFNAVRMHLRSRKSM